MNINGFALVTGSGSGIGRACALAFAFEGAAGVVFADLNLESVEKAAQESKRLATNPAYRALVLTLDVTNEEQVESVVAEAKQAFGRIDYMVNSAGV